MNRWSGALERAFEAHLKSGGSSGSSGSSPQNANQQRALRVDGPGTTAPEQVVPVVPSSPAGTTGTTPGGRVVPAGGSTKCSAFQRLRTSGTTGTTEIAAMSALRAGAFDLTRATAPSQWVRGLATLEPECPAPNFSREEWQQLIEDGKAFLAEWDSAAAKLGWSDFDLFGVHPVAPTARYDVMGLIPLMRGSRVVAVDEQSATIRSRRGSLLTYLRRPSAGAVLVWNLV